MNGAMHNGHNGANGELLTAALDFDDTLKPFRAPFIEWYNRLSGTDIDYTQIDRYDLAYYMGLGEQDRHKVPELVDQYHEQEMQDTSLSIPAETVEVLGRLSLFFRFPVITARKNRFKPYTLAQMSQALPAHRPEAHHREDYESLSTTKGRLAKKIGALVLVDDHAANVEAALSEGLEAILVADQLNRGYDGRAPRVDNWRQIEEELMAIHERHLNGDFVL